MEVSRSSLPAYASTYEYAAVTLFWLRSDIAMQVSNQTGLKELMTTKHPQTTAFFVIARHHPAGSQKSLSPATAS